MHTRFVRVQASPQGAEDRIAAFERQALPLIRQQAGNAGAALLIDRESGRGGTVTYWENEGAMQSSEEALAPMRTRITGEHGIQVVGMEDYEITLMERAQPAEAGTCCRVVRGSASDLDEVTRAVRESGLTAVRSSPGFRALICGLDRGNGRFMIASVWNTPADRQNSETGIAPVREEMERSAGASSIEVEHYDVAVADIPARTGVRS